MMAKTRGAKSKSSLNTVIGEHSDASASSSSGSVERGDLKLSVSRIRMSDYEIYHHNKEKLKGKFIETTNFQFNLFPIYVDSIEYILSRM